MLATLLHVWWTSLSIPVDICILIFIFYKEKEIGEVERKKTCLSFLKEIEVCLRIWKIRQRERKLGHKSWSGYCVQRRKSKKRDCEMMCKQHRIECVLQPRVFAQDRLGTNSAKLNRHKQLRPKEKKCSCSHPLPSQGLPLTNCFLVSSVTSAYFKFTFRWRVSTPFSIYSNKKFLPSFLKKDKHFNIVKQTTFSL